MGKGICVDELRDRLIEFDGGLVVTTDGYGLSIVDDDGDEDGYIPFTEEV